MSIFKCKMCGGTIEFEPGATVGVCEYCGTKQTLPRLDDDRRTNLYDRANHFRRNNEFDKAAGIYEQILNEDTTDAEAYWSLVLCRYGIEYVEDPATRHRVPTVNRAQFTSIFDDDNYKSALQYADDSQRELYEAEAKTINDIQKGILAISQKEEPFDVFICYKETDNSGRRTQDSVLANDLYHQLTQEGFKVFFSRITLEDKLGTAYEPYIFAALNSAKAMVVLGTKPEYFNAVWVKNEWSRYLSIVKQSGGKKVLIPAYRDMDPYDLPDEFSHLQAQDMSKLGFMQDLIRGIKKIVQTDEPKATVQETVMASSNSNTAPLLRRAFMYLEDGQWQNADEYCERILDQDPENAQAYLGKLMAELHIHKQEDLADFAEPFDSLNNYQKAVRFGDEKTRTTLKGYITYINERNENTRLTGNYNKAVNAMNAASTEMAFISAAKTFESIPGFKDADELAKKSREKAEIYRKDAIYSAGIKSMNAGKGILGYEAAIKEFKAIPGWKDADEQISACEEKIEQIKAEEEARRLEQERIAEEARLATENAMKKRKKIIAITAPTIIACAAFIFILTKVIIPNSKYKSAVDLYNSGNYDEAITAFEALDGYKDSEDQINAAKYSKAEVLLKEGKFDEAYTAFSELGDYNDSADKALETIYMKAEALLSEGRLEEAASSFRQIPEYKDSANRANIIIYDLASDLFDNGNYKDACSLFEEIDYYSDSNERATECRYQIACGLLESGQFDSAISAFNEIKEYKDSGTQIENCYIGKYGAVKYDLIKKNIQVGDTITFGKYEQDKNAKDGKEDIEWIVLDKQGSLILVISKYVLDKHEFGTKYSICYWEGSLMRSWLKSAFFNTFSDEEQKLIVTKTISNQNQGEDTEDRIFLLSRAEAAKYFSSNSSRKAVDYANKEPSIWTLRTTTADGFWVLSVNDDGSIETSGRGFIAKLGVRPAMWIDIGE